MQEVELASAQLRMCDICNPLSQSNANVYITTTFFCQLKSEQMLDMKNITQPKSNPSKSASYQAPRGCRNCAERQWRHKMFPFSPSVFLPGGLIIIVSWPGNSDRNFPSSTWNSHYPPLSCPIFVLQDEQGCTIWLVLGSVTLPLCIVLLHS